MTESTVEEMVFVFLFRCEKCRRPVTSWLRTPSPPTFQKAKEQHVMLRCVLECGWTDAKPGSKAVESWAVPWHNEKEM